MARRRSRVTIADVANHLGISKSTVSRALNDYPDIAESNRQRVRAAVERLGYRPSSHARSLKRTQVESIGFVVSMNDRRLSDPFLAELLIALSRSLEAMHYDLLLSTASTPSDTVEVYQRMLDERKVDGFVVNRTEVDDPRIDYLRAQGVPFVARGRSADSDDYAWWDIDNEFAFVEAVRHVVALGHRRIGLLGARAHLNFAHQRRAGYRRGLREARIEHDPALEIEIDLEESAGYDATLQLLADQGPPTALLAATDTIAIGALAAIRRLGLEVGRDVTVIGYDGLPVGAFASPPLTTFSQPTRKSGTRLALMLLDLIGGADPRDLQVLERAQLVRRESDGPPAASPDELAKKIHSLQHQSRRNLHV